MILLKIVPKNTGINLRLARSSELYYTSTWLHINYSSKNHIQPSPIEMVENIAIDNMTKELSTITLPSVSTDGPYQEIFSLLCYFHMRWLKLWMDWHHHPCPGLKNNFIRNSIQLASRYSRAACGSRRYHYGATSQCATSLQWRTLWMEGVENHQGRKTIDPGRGPSGCLDSKNFLHRGYKKLRVKAMMDQMFTNAAIGTGMSVVNTGTRHTMGCEWAVPCANWTHT